MFLRLTRGILQIASNDRVAESPNRGIAESPNRRVAERRKLAAGRQRKVFRFSKRPSGAKGPLTMVFLPIYCRGVFVIEQRRSSKIALLHGELSRIL